MPPVDCGAGGGARVHPPELPGRGPGGARLLPQPHQRDQRGVVLHQRHLPRQELGLLRRGARAAPLLVRERRQRQHRGHGDVLGGLLRRPRGGGARPRPAPRAPAAAALGGGRQRAGGLQGPHPDQGPGRPPDGGGHRGEDLHRRRQVRAQAGPRLQRQAGALRPHRAARSERAQLHRGREQGARGRGGRGLLLQHQRLRAPTYRAGPGGRGRRARAPGGGVQRHHGDPRGHGRDHHPRDPVRRAGQQRARLQGVHVRGVVRGLHGRRERVGELLQ
mmetsp:Transcript_1137/g.4642  ORF Transcript_1137/g.4642 Transcript_1137/m.4642 type:complete len:276 (-) Transcript_1137:106-933(-)